MEYKFINPEYIDSVSSGDSSIIIEIAKLFEEQVPEMLNEMKILFGQKKYYDLGLLAHKAKSSVAIMGMAGLAQMLKTFELQAKESLETEKYRSYIDRFDKETSEAIRELGHLVSTLQKP
ncbi:MAG: Hpt domain-containing protein [Bacteroidales bacterium]|jgi:HPt (histidine-containing phosphotransfer) domain-containing protein|nr:Hpt domain-containing protein [Bacteroidales bacterium]